MAIGVHHSEVWVADLDRARLFWGWLLMELGWSLDQEWDNGTSWRCGNVYLVTTRPPALSGGAHDRRLPGINHLALHGRPQDDVDRVLFAATENYWTSLYADRYPRAGGPEHYSAYLKN